MVWILSAVLAIARLSFFAAIYFSQSHDAQWQLSYLPLWFIDLPISILYFKLPIPWAEAIIGPVWWFLLPVIIWRVFRTRKIAQK